MWCGPPGRSSRLRSAPSCVPSLPLSLPPSDVVWRWATWSSRAPWKNWRSRRCWKIKTKPIQLWTTRRFWRSNLFLNQCVTLSFSRWKVKLVSQSMLALACFLRDLRFPPAFRIGKWLEDQKTISPTYGEMLCYNVTLQSKSEVFKLWVATQTWVTLALSLGRGSSPDPKN